MKADPQKVVVIGIDGGTFDVMGPLMDRGELPHLASMRGGGVCAELVSVIPTLTPTAFASFMTGVNPGKHGFFDFVAGVHDNYKPSALKLSHSSIPVRTLWEILTEQERRVILLAVPLSYPAPEVNGIVVSHGAVQLGMPHCLHIHPPELAVELLRRGEFDQRQILASQSMIDFSGSRNDYRRSLADAESAHRYLMEKLRQGILYLMKEHPWDLFMVHFSVTDQLQHYYWKFMDSSHVAYDPELASLYQEAIPDAYRRIDSIIGEMMRVAGEQATVIAMSDHGFCPIHRLFSPNAWLKEKGLLAIAPRARSLTVTHPTISRGLTKMGLSRVKSLLPHAVLELHFPMLRRVEWPMSKLVAWRRTKAYAVSHGGINVNLKGREPCGVVRPGVEFEAVLHTLTEELLRLQDPETGQRIVENVTRKEELFEGPFVGEAPDLYFFFKKDFSCFPKLDVGSNEIFKKPSMNHNLSAHHLASLEALKGILFMGGPTVSRGAEVRDARLLDLAPTILYLLGLPIPDYMDGRVLERAFIPERLAARPPIRARADASPMKRRLLAQYEDEEGQIRAQLKGLGYLG